MNDSGLRILRVETGFVSTPVATSEDGLIDYRVYEKVPRRWRRLEERMRLDIYLALRAQRLANGYDIVWAGSEKVAIPLSFMGLRQPLVVVAHYMESPLRARLAKMTGIARAWSAVGYQSNEGRAFFINYLGVRPERLFQYESAKYLDCIRPELRVSTGPIISVGVAKRDYNLLVDALSTLPGYDAELFPWSKHGNQLEQEISLALPEWVCLVSFLPLEDLIRHYLSSRFVVVCLKETKHSGAGINAVLEAGAFGKAVIATRTGGMESFVKDGVTGLLVPPGDVEALREAIQCLWTQPELAFRMGIANRQFIEARFHPKTIETNIERMLTKLGCENGR